MRAAFHFSLLELIMNNAAGPLVTYIRRRRCSVAMPPCEGFRAAETICG